MEYGRNVKKIVFRMWDHDHAKLFLKATENNIRLATLLRMFIKAYVEDDPLIKQWAETYKGVKLSDRSLKKRRSEERKARLMNEKFNLDQKELDELFDILEDEMDD